MTFAARYILVYYHLYEARFLGRNAGSIFKQWLVIEPTLRDEIAAEAQKIQQYLQT